MTEKEIQISESLGGLIKQMDGEQVAHVKEMFSFYMEQFSQLKATTNSESISSAIHDTVQQAINEQIAQADRPISCSRGCNFCCYQRVDISDDEAILLLAYSKEIGFEIDFEKLERQAKAKDDKEFMALRPRHKRCVFLNKEGDCGVYEHRPSVCRKYVVVSPAEDCDTVKYPNGRIEKLVDLEAEVLTSSSLNYTESGSLAEMILKHRKDG